MTKAGELDPSPKRTKTMLVVGKEIQWITIASIKMKNSEMKSKDRREGGYEMCKMCNSVYAFPAGH